MGKGRRDMQLFFAGPTLNWVYIVRSLHRYFRLFHEPTLVPQLVVYIAAALTGRRRCRPVSTRFTRPPPVPHLASGRVHSV